MKNTAICEEVEWQLTFGQGWLRAMQAVGYDNPLNLARLLHRAGRHDLARVFDATDQ